KNILPVLPAMAVVTAWGPSLLQPPAVKQIMLGGGIVWFLCQLWLGGYGCSILPPQVYVRLGWGLPQPCLLQQSSTHSPGGGGFLARKEKWSILEILSRITGRSMGPSKLVRLRAQAMLRPAVVAVLPNHPFFNVSNFAYFSVLKDLPVRIEQIGNPQTAEAKDY